jgi:hypothetical protein
MRGLLTPIAVLLGIGLLSAGCQPKDTRPGLWLQGERVEAPVQDWRFTDDAQEIFIETRAWYGLRHSTTIWCVELDGRLYIGSYDDDVKFWERNVDRNPTAQLGIEGRLYDVAITPIANGETRQRLDERYAAKYDMVEVFGEDLPAWRYYNVELLSR